MKARPGLVLHRTHLRTKLKEKGFAKGYRVELQVARIAVALERAQEKLGLNQSKLAKRAGIT